MRSHGLALVALLALCATPAAAQETDRPDAVPTVAAAESRPGPAVAHALVATPEYSVTVDQAGVPESPSSRRPSFPIEVLTGAAFAASTRRKAGKRSQVPMILDSHVHVMRENKKGDSELKAIPGGVLVDDTDLTDDEVDELTARKAIRPAKPDEVARLERGDVEKERADLVAAQEDEIGKLRAKHEAQRAELGDDASPTKVAALEKKQGAELEKLQAQHTKALNKLAE